MNVSDKLLTPYEASILLKVSKQTLVNWEHSGKIKALRTKGNHRRYLRSSIIKQSDQSNYSCKKKDICYCRVSSHSQKKDLETQVEFFKNKFPGFEIIKDIGSGLNYKRKGFNSILDQAIQGNVRTVVVTHKDRFCRFGFEFFQEIISKYSNGKLLVLD